MVVINMADENHLNLTRNWYESNPSYISQYHYNQYNQGKSLTQLTLREGLIVNK